MEHDHEIENISNNLSFQKNLELVMTSRETRKNMGDLQGSVYVYLWRFFCSKGKCKLA